VSSHDESEFPSPLVAGFGPTDGIRSLSSSQIGSGGRGKATAELATMPTSDFSPIGDNRTSGSAEKVEACGDIEVRRAVLLKRVSGVKWFHQIDLGGMLTRGVKPMANAAFQASVALKDIAGKTVLDVGAWDGYFSFAAERGGAARVLATDHFCWVGPGWGKIDGFLTARDILASA